MLHMSYTFIQKKNDNEQLSDCGHVPPLAPVKIYTIYNNKRKLLMKKMQMKNKHVTETETKVGQD